MAVGEIPAVPVRSPQQLGDALARIRGLKGRTQTELARDAGIRQATISSVEAGARGTELWTVFSLLAALDLELVVRERVARPVPLPTRGENG